LELEAITVRARSDGSSVTFVERGDATISLSPDRRPDSVAALWRDAKVIFGYVRRDVGRRTGSGTIQDDDRICEAVREMRVAGIRVTRATLAARAGFTEDELRGYLGSTERSLAQLIKDCAQ